MYKSIFFKIGEKNNALLKNNSFLKRLDIGELAVTIYRLITDRKFIHKIKEEFVYGSFNSKIQGYDLHLEELISYDFQI